MADQRDRQAAGAGAAGTADAVHVLVAGARHVEVDHQVEVVDIQAAGGHIGGHQHLAAALAEAVDGQLAVLLVLLAVQHEGLVVQGHQVAVETVDLGAGVAEDHRLAVRLVGQQPLHQALLVRRIVGRDDLLDGGRAELVDAVELQMQRLAQHLGDHLAQYLAAAGGGEQQGLLAVGAFVGDALDVLGEAQIEHAVGLVQHQHLDTIELEAAGVEVLHQPAGGGDQQVGLLAQQRGLLLEVLTAGDQASLDEGVLGEALDLLEDLLGQLAGRQQDQRTHVGALLRVGIAEQAVEQRQQEGRGLAAAGLRRHPQVAPLQRRRNGRLLHRRRLGEVQLGDGLEQAFMQGELGEHWGLPRHGKSETAA